MSNAITLISSMATRHLLTALAQAYAQAGTQAVLMESVGGVDAARRLQEGEAFDIVVLAADAIAELNATGRLRPGSVRAIADSSVAIAVRTGTAEPDVSTEAALRAAIGRARAIGYSTGPSGRALLQHFERWGLADTLRDRLVQARPGVPVGSLVAKGEAEIGFQQLSELMDLPGITLLGGMPPGTDIVSRFCGAVTAGCAQPEKALALLDFMASPRHDALRQQYGMHGAHDAH